MEDSSSDTYNVGNAGAVGKNAKAENFKIQTNNHNSNNGELKELSIELRRLKIALTEQFKDEVPIDSAEHIENAIIEAENGNRELVVKHLKNISTKALGVAEKIGVGLAISAIKAALGI